MRKRVKEAFLGNINDHYDQSFKRKINIRMQNECIQNNKSAYKFISKH